MPSIIPGVRWRSLRKGHVSEVRITDGDTGMSRPVLRDGERVLESPNWSPDGRSLLVNCAGRLYRIPLDAPRLEEIPTPGIDDHNNDHQYSPDGSIIYTSSEGDGHIYAVPAAGGAARRITPQRPGPFSHFLQAVSLDGRHLHYVGAGPHDGGLSWELHRIRTDGTGDERLTSFGTVTIGFEEDAEGRRYFSSEHETRQAGTSQIFRMTPGDQIEQLTHGSRSSWFPKLAPDGSRLVYLSFPEASGFHPADVDVRIMRMDLPSKSVRQLVALTGGQGSLNMNSWAPHGRELAYVAYPSAIQTAQTRVDGGFGGVRGLADPPAHALGPHAPAEPAGPTVPGRPRRF